MDNFAYQSELMQLIVLAMREKDNGNLNDVEIARIIDLWKMALTPTRTKTFQHPTTVHSLKKSFSPHPPQLRHPRSPPLPLHRAVACGFTRKILPLTYACAQKLNSLQSKSELKRDRILCHTTFYPGIFIVTNT